MREADQQSAERRYADLERRYEELRRRMEGAPVPATATGGQSDGLPYPRLFVGAETARALGPAPGEPGRSEAVGRMAPGLPGPDLPLRARLDDGFSFVSPDDELQLRLRVLDQNDGKIFVPNNQSPARSGLFIPRVRVSFEG